MLFELQKIFQLFIVSTSRISCLKKFYSFLLLGIGNNASKILAGFGGVEAVYARGSFGQNVRFIPGKSDFDLIVILKDLPCSEERVALQRIWKFLNGLQYWIPLFKDVEIWPLSFWDVWIKQPQHYQSLILNDLKLISGKADNVGVGNVPTLPRIKSEVQNAFYFYQKFVLASFYQSTVKSERLVKSIKSFWFKHPNLPAVPKYDSDPTTKKAELILADFINKWPMSFSAENKNTQILKWEVVDGVRFSGSQSFEKPGAASLKGKFFELADAVRSEPCFKHLILITEGYRLSSWKIYLIHDITLGSKECARFYRHVLETFQRFQRLFEHPFFSRFPYPILVPEGYLGGDWLFLGNAFEYFQFLRKDFLMTSSGEDLLAFRKLPKKLLDDSVNLFFLKTTSYVRHLLRQEAGSAASKQKFLFNWVDLSLRVLPLLKIYGQKYYRSDKNDFLQEFQLDQLPFVNETQEMILSKIVSGQYASQATSLLAAAPSNWYSQLLTDIEDLKNIYTCEV